uniref:DUF637 domain-containing protein n=2 Tax=unclassified Pseudomonas TaxID=196821 RepID=UPI000AEE9913
GRDLRLVASKVSAGEEAYLVAGDKLELLAANDSQYSLYDMSKKGGWGSKQTQRDEVTDVKAVGSEVSSGGDLTLKSGGDQLYQGAKLASGADLTIDSGGAVTFEAVKDLHQESHEKSKSNVGWFSMKGEGRTDETVRQSELVAKGDLVINAVGKIHVDVRQVNQQTVSKSIDAMVKADPKLAWLKQVEAQGGVDWRQVKEIHDSFKYSNSGLGPAAQLAIAIVMAAVVGPAAAAWAGGGVTGAAVGAVATGAATNASVSVVNNRGNLGAVVKDVTSSDAMKGYVISGVAAGLTAAYFDGWTGTKTDPVTGKVLGPKLYTIKGVGQFAANQTLQNGTSLLLSKALGQGGSASDALKSALFNTLAAASFNAVGDYTKQFGIENGSLPKIAIHAMVGGLLSKATGGDFKTGALAAGANEALVVQLNKLVGGNENLLTMSSQIVGVLAAASQEDADASSLDKAAWVAKNGTQYNYLEHLDVLAFAKDMNGCGTDESCQTDKWIKEKYDDESLRNVEEAQNTYGPQRAKEKSLQIAQSIDTLMSVQCTTARCETYKTALLERSIDSYARLSKVLNEWAPTLDRLGLVGGAAAGKQAGSRPVGVPERAELAQVQRAVDYLAGTKATSIEFLPKATRNSAGQIEANITQSSAIKTLESNGYKKTISQDGSVAVLTNGEKTYRFYPSSTSTGQPSASLTVEGVKKPTAKIRFSGE